MLDTFKRLKKVSQRKKLHCSYCKSGTIHNLEARCIGTWNDPHNQNSGGEEYSIFRCGGCDTVCFESSGWDDHEVDYDENDEPYHARYTKQYPPPISAQFNFNTEHTPHLLDSILEEMLYAMAGSKMMLATIGLRLAVEFIVNDKDCKGNTLVQKINDLYAQGHVDEDQKDMLHQIRKRGNNGAHQAKGMKPKEMMAGMAIIAGLLEKLYNGPARHAATIAEAKAMFKTDEIGP